jgi:hypothetical protein
MKTVESKQKKKKGCHFFFFFGTTPRRCHSIPHCNETPFTHTSKEKSKKKKKKKFFFLIFLIFCVRGTEKKYFWCGRRDVKKNLS